MTAQPMLDRALDLWETLAGPGAKFRREHEVEVHVTPASGLCPSGWIGIVRLADRLLVTVPDPALALPVQDALNLLDLAACTDPVRLGAVFDIAETLGPASLGYLDPHEFHPVETVDVVRRPATDPGIGQLLRAVTPAEAEDSGLDSVDSTAFLVRGAGGFVSGAGYRRWPGGAAHVSVLTALTHRGEGLGKATASAAVAAALGEGLLPQWRARLPESRAVAAALGFREFGSQFSFRLG